MEERAEARVEAIALLAKRLGMSVRVLIVGDVRIVLDESWPKSVNRQAGAQTESIIEDAKSADPKLLALRERSRKQFGRVLPDEALMAMDGVL